MPSISRSVGSGGGNAAQDVAMVQFMLKVLKDSRKVPYFAAPYTNSFSGTTVQAITAFQNAKGLAKTGSNGGERPGLVVPDSPTWKAMTSALASAGAQYKATRAMEGFGLVYASMPDSSLAKSLGGIQTAGLQPDFQSKVAQLTRNFFSATGIAWTLVPQTGGWRPFKGQAGLVSDAGYGESIHQYGYAVDMTVADFTWFGPDLVAHTSRIGLSGMERKYLLQLYTARNTVATALNLHSTTKAGDLAHLQNYDDDSLDSAGSLIALLQAVGPRKMKWKSEFRTPTNYHCDLGLGGKLVFVGTAVDIWEQSQTKRISAASLASVLAEKKKADSKFSAELFLGRSDTPFPKEPSEKDIRESDIKAVQKMLRAEFDAAAANWRQWKPIKYPNAERRPPNPVKR